MPYVADIDLESSVGELTVEFGDRRITYRSIAEIREALGVVPEGQRVGRHVLRI